MSVVWNHTVDEVLGDEEHGVTGVRCALRERRAGRELSVTGLFVAIGHTPNTALFSGQLAMREGYLTVRAGLDGDATATSVAGRVRRRRCRRPRLPAGRHLGGRRLHGGARCRPLSGEPRRAAHR